MMAASYTPAPAAKLSVQPEVPTSRDDVEERKAAASSTVPNGIPTPRRVLCVRCARPVATCVCGALPKAPIALTTRVLVLQHPREAKKAVGSVRLLPLCLEHVQIVEAAVPWKRGSEPLHAPSQLEWLQRSIREGYEPLLLFPSNGAIALDERREGDIEGHAQRHAQADERRRDAPLNAARGGANDAGVWTGLGHSGRREQQQQQQQQQPEKKALLVMIDGTWSQARHLLRHSPTMAAACTHVKFEAEREAIIGALRREPERHCTSTLEACARMLRVVEPTPQAEAAAAHMEATLRAMVEAQNQFRVR
jgi:DTW domain-containing protein YfiP